MIIPTSPPNCGRSLGLWFLNNLVVTAVIAYAAHAALGEADPVAGPMPSGNAMHGTHPYLRVFQAVGSIGLDPATYGMAAGVFFFRWV